MDRSESFHYGAKLIDHLEFSMTILNKHGGYYTPMEIQLIQGWLFGRIKPNKFIIYDDCGEEHNYECWLISPEKIKIGYNVIGWNFIVRCTSTYSLTDLKTETINCLSDTNIIKYRNRSSVEDYVYPEMNIKLDNNTSSIEIINKSDNNRIFRISNVRKGEEIYVNNDLGYMDTKSGDNILDNFNLDYFRVVNGINDLTINGKCVITIKAKFKMAIGGY